ncbi:MAG: outer membrane beta-barrel protein [Caldithrix sp.]|nr:outer membrane beta-barrel protein [Caldithrix sp.]
MKIFLILLFPFLVFAQKLESKSEQPDSSTITQLSNSKDWIVGIKYSLFNNESIIQDEFNWYEHGKTNFVSSSPKIFIKVGYLLANKIQLSSLLGFRIINYTNNFNVTTVSDYIHTEIENREMEQVSFYFNAQLTYYFLNRASNDVIPFIAFGIGKVFTNIKYADESNLDEPITVKSNEEDFHSDINSPLFGGISAGIEYTLNPSIYISIGYQLSAHYSSGKYYYEYLTPHWHSHDYFINREIEIFALNQNINIGVNYLF